MAQEGPIIRFATKNDVHIVLSFIQALALYEKTPESVQATEATLLSTLSFPPFPSPGYARVLLLFAPGSPPEPAGMALYFFNYSTWRSMPGIYLEDLFVKPEFRGRGYGGRLLAELAREVGAMGGARLEWSVLKWNEPSIKFYKGIGAKPQDEWMGMRVDGETLVELAKKGQGLS